MIDPRAADQITHNLADVIRFRLLMISAGYEDGNDANAPTAAIRYSRWRSIFRPSIGSWLAVDNIAVGDLPDVRAVLRMGRAMVDLYCRSFATVPKRITLDIDDTFDAVQVVRWPFTTVPAPTTTNTDSSRSSYSTAKRHFVTAVLRPAKQPSGKEISRPGSLLRDPARAPQT